jgi:threonine/homoserine/homoserine lactone efflux protein
VSIQFLLTSLAFAAIPGTGVVYVVATGLLSGARASVSAALGCTLGIIPHVLAAVTGLVALLHTSPLAFHTFKYLGVAYLIYMAWNTLRDTDALTELDPRPRSARSVITSGILINVFNPKLTIFFFAFLPQFVDTNEPSAWPRMIGLSAMFMLMTLVVFIGYGKFAASVRDQVISRPRVLMWTRRTFAGGFAALGLRLAFIAR